GHGPQGTARHRHGVAVSRNPRPARLVTSATPSRDACRTTRKNLSEGSWTQTVTVPARPDDTAPRGGGGGVELGALSPAGRSRHRRDHRRDGVLRRAGVRVHGG